VYRRVDRDRARGRVRADCHAGHASNLCGPRSSSGSNRWNSFAWVTTFSPPPQGACHYRYLCPFDDQVAGRGHRDETVHVGSEANDPLRSPPRIQRSISASVTNETGRSGAASADRSFSARLSALKTSETTSVSTTTAFMQPMQPDQSQDVPAIRATLHGNRRCFLLWARSRRIVPTGPRPESCLPPASVPRSRDVRQMRTSARSFVL